MTSEAQRVAVICLDMGDATLIRQWADQGRLPVLARLAQNGHWFDLRSTAEVLHTSTWPTFATGAGPGTHGVYYPYQPTPGHQTPQLITDEQYGCHTFWHRADQAGKRCVVYDVPETFPEAGFAGRAIFDWGTWAWYGERTSRPESLLAELRRQFGDYPLGIEAKQLGARLPDLDDLEKRLQRSIEYKCRSGAALLRSDWDLAVLSYCELHPAGHYFLAEPDRMLRLYAALDTAIGQLSEALGDDTAVVVTSGDGAAPNYCGWHLVPAVLRQLGFSAEAERGMVSAASLAGRLKSAVPSNLRRAIADALPWWLRDRLGAGIQEAAIDWSASRAFALPSDLEGCIRVNLRGREPQGIVQPGAEYDSVCNELREAFAGLENPATGKPAVREVHLANQTFPGPMQEHLPDVIVGWADDAPIHALRSERLGTVALENPDRRPGTHSRRGFALVCGAARALRPPTARGTGGDDPWGGRPHLVDLAPTILGLLGVDPAPHMQGSSLLA